MNCIFYIDLENLIHAAFLKHVPTDDLKYEYIFTIISMIENKLKGMKIVTIDKKMYADFNKISSPSSEDLFVHKIEQVNVLSTKYKNSVDSKIIVDVMESLFCKTNVKCYVIISGDRDFIPLYDMVKKYSKDLYVSSFSGSISKDVMDLFINNFFKAEDFLTIDQINRLDKFKKNDEYLQIKNKLIENKRKREAEVNEIIRHSSISPTDTRPTVLSPVVLNTMPLNTNNTRPVVLSPTITQSIDPIRLNPVIDNPVIDTQSDDKPITSPKKITKKNKHTISKFTGQPYNNELNCKKVDRSDVMILNAIKLLISMDKHYKTGYVGIVFFNKALCKQFYITIGMQKFILYKIIEKNVAIIQYIEEHDKQYNCLVLNKSHPDVVVLYDTVDESFYKPVIKIEYNL
jgi:uncharacterized LabA/DUF88 family protein